MTTPCEILGYKVGQKFKLIEDVGFIDLKKGDIVELYNDDGTASPKFISECRSRKFFLNLGRIKPITNQERADCPEHYDNIIQPWEYMQSCMSPEEFRGYMRGNVLKYISRYTKKDGIKDLKKCKDYLEELIEFEKGMLMDSYFYERLYKLYSNNYVVKAAVSVDYDDPHLWTDPVNGYWIENEPKRVRDSSKHIVEETK